MRALHPRPLVAGAALAALAFSVPGSSRAADTARIGLKPFDVTIRVFDPTRGPDQGQDYVLPVDSPDEEHAIASTIANAASFTTKADGATPRPVAFTCIKVEPRP